MIPAGQMGGFAPAGAQSRREIAQIAGLCTGRYARTVTTCHVGFAAGCSSKRASAHCQHRYPSPCRSALSQGRPANPFQGDDGNWAAKRFDQIFGLELRGFCSESARVNKINKGSIPCLTRSSLSSQLRRLRFRLVPASTQMASAQSSVPVSAAWRAKRWTTIVRPAHWSVQLAAHWPTTSKTKRSQDLDQARGDFRLIRTVLPQGACASPATRRVSAPLKHHQGAFSCASLFQSSPFWGLPPVQARLRHPHPSWRHKAWLHQQWKQHRLPCPSSATPTAIARLRANTPRISATDITNSRRRGLPPVAVLRSKEPSHV